MSISPSKVLDGFETSIRQCLRLVPENTVNVIDVSHSALSQLTAREHGLLLDSIRNSLGYAVDLDKAVQFARTNPVSYLVGNDYVVTSEYSAIKNKLNEVFQALPVLSENNGSAFPRMPLRSIKQVITDLEPGDKITVSYLFTRPTYNPKKLQGTLGNFKVDVTFDDKYVAATRLIEKKLALRLQDPAFLENLLVTPGSPSIKDNIENHIASILNGDVIGSQAYADKSGYREFNYKPRKKVVATPAPKIKQPQLRTKTGQFYSPTSLANYINLNLAERIKRNMGDGSRRDILNLRSGRFAESASVTRVTRSSKDMLSIFYTYMTYPYQTFEPGFKQGSPASRDPRLLIGKSIRELATQKVSNRLRTIRIGEGVADE